MKNKRVLLYLIIIFLQTGKLIAYENLLNPLKDAVGYLNLTKDNDQASILIPSELNWSYNGLGRVEEEKLFSLLDPIILNSFNSDFAYGGLDSGLWQGRGFNTMMNFGVKLTTEFCELQLSPQIYYSQNISFGTFNSDFTNPNPYIDNPERMGDSSIFDYSWGQSVIKVKYNNLSLGFGTENIWIGPAKYNPIILSNNAEGIPKVSLRMKPTETYLGIFEVLLFYGYLEESIVDNGSDNSSTFINMLSIGYTPPFFQYVTFTATRVVLADWDTLSASDFYTMFNFDLRGGDDDYGLDLRDQRFSASMDLKFPEQGFRGYIDIGRNDFSPNLEYILRAPQHTVAYTLGLEQLIFKKEDLSIFAESEISSLILSEDYEIDLVRNDGASFYAHGLLKNGYTNDGQLLAAPIGTGSDSQLFGISALWNDYFLRIFYQRIGNNFDYLLNHYEAPEGIKRSNVYSILGISTTYTYDRFYFKINFQRIFEMNNNYEIGNDEYNIYSSIELGYSF